MTAFPEKPDLYAVLGVASDAAPSQIARAFRSLVRLLHPDVTAQTISDTDRYSAVVAAYQVLHDPQRRAAYDATRRERQQPAPVRAVLRPLSQARRGDITNVTGRVVPALRVGPVRSAPLHPPGQGQVP